MSKKLTVFLLVALMIATTVLAGCQPATNGGNATSGEPQVSGEPAQSGEPTTTPSNVKNEVIVGTNTEPSGDFATPWWQNNATDVSVNSQLYWYGTLDTNKAGEFVWNKTVLAKDPEVTANEDGSKTYTFTINDGLQYSDGTPITAKDYVAQMVLFSSKQMVDLKAKPTAGFYLVGYNEFNEGTAKEFAGVRLLDDKTFSFTLAKENVPNYWEITQVSAGPEPLKFWLGEEYDIKDDGNGAYITPELKVNPDDDKDPIKVKVDTARFAVERPTCGPYKLKSYDPSTKTVVLERDENWKGNFEGQKPSIDTLIYKKVESATAMDELKTGSVDLLEGMSSGDEINAGLTVVEESNGGFSYVDYPRNGYGKLLFTCDLYPTKDAEVRQAIAHLLDRKDFANSFTGGFGGVVNGPYGDGVWEYQESKSVIDSQIDTYEYSLDKAKELLDKAGWNLDEKGQPYPGTGLRYKKDEAGKLMPLKIKWCSSEKNPVSELLVVKLMKNKDVEAAGIVIEQDTMDFDTLLNYLYRDGSQDKKYSVPIYNMFNLGSGFTLVYNPELYYTTKPELLAQGYNENYIIDPELEKLADNLAKVDPTDKEGFLKNFQNYIIHWNKALPDLPLYSNIYHDFFNSKIKGYENSATIGIPMALLYSHVE
ncbi:ABC transporter substrate-binding protein [Guggenheimella bovis]